MLSMSEVHLYGCPYGSVHANMRRGRSLLMTVAFVISIWADYGLGLLCRQGFIRQVLHCGFLPY
jgi:hypothetical protein